MSLELSRLDFPDGNRWLLGESGLGRPFMVRLLLVNRGTKPVRIWHPQSSEGAPCAMVVLQPHAAGAAIRLRPLPPERAAGVPTAATLEPHEVVSIDLELLRLIDGESPPEDTYDIIGIYENRLAKSGGITVWVGRVEKAAEDPITIVRP